MESKLLKFFKLDNLFDSISGYLETRLELFKLEAREEIAETTAKGIQAVIIILMFLFALMFLSMALAFFIGMWLDQVGYGFLIVGGFYAFLALTLYLLRGRIGLKEKINRYLGSKIADDE